MNTQKATLEAIETLNSKGIKADYMFPSYNSNEEDERFQIRVHGFNLEAAKSILPKANVLA